MAFGILRAGPHAEDAVQDAVVMAEELLERQALQNWTVHAVNQLSEPLRHVTLLRYFTDLSSYDQIAACCGVPVGSPSSLTRAHCLRTEIANDSLFRDRYTAFTTTAPATWSCKQR